jgi:hypothetical protein
MPVSTAILVWISVGAYAGVGVLFALMLIVGGLRRFDPAAARAPWRVKLLITPGLILLWPIVGLRLLGLKPREDRG